MYICNTKWTGYHIDIIILVYVSTDIDECCLELDNCDPIGGQCIDITGSFECECLPGFTGDGLTCEGQVLFMHLYFAERMI